MNFFTLTACAIALAGPLAAATQYPDGRPEAALRINAKDTGPVFRHGGGPDQCDVLGARDIWVYESDGTFYMHYDGSGPKGWLACLATSKDLTTWQARGPVLDFGAKGEMDSASASYGVTYYDGQSWHMFYLGTPNVTPAPDFIPFTTKPGTYYSITASPGQVLKHEGEYLMFFSATTRKAGNPCVQRTLGIARTKNLDGQWTPDPTPMVPIEEQVENSSIYYEPANKTWFLFTNHIGLDGGEYTDAIWVYWTQDPNKWDAKNKAVVLDGQNCTWSKKCIGLPGVLKTGNRLAILYDAPSGSSHMKRDIGLAWLDLPLAAPVP
jgi:predicted GH43/DUF377 family glycosyl hydrolase